MNNDHKNKISRPVKPLIIFDGDCGFCRRSLSLIENISQEKFDSIEAAAYQGNISQEDLKKAVYLYWQDGRIESGAAAIWSLLKLADHPLGAWLYFHINLFRLACDFSYRMIAKHRSSAAKILKHLLTLKSTADQHSIGLRVLESFTALSFFSFFLSFFQQANGLWGPNGIAFINAPPQALKLLLGLGAFLSLSLFCKKLTAIGNFLCLILAWFFIMKGDPFTSFQWDMLLLEVSFLLFIQHCLSRSFGPHVLLRLATFKLFFSSGMVKILSSNPAWRDLSALTAHFSTQPLPTPFSTFFHHMPESFLRAGSAVTLFIQLVLPWFIFLPFKIRKWPLLLLLIHQFTILASGNYTFFNLLGIGLLFGCLPNQFYSNLFIDLQSNPSFLLKLWKLPISFLITLYVAITSISHIPGLRLHDSLNLNYLKQLGLSNGYGLFASMTMTRPEIIVETSSDGINWSIIDFPHKPDGIGDCPTWIAPFQPRLDWQMWFAALAGPNQRPNWFDRFVFQLLNHSEDVWNLLSPFPNFRDVRYLRANIIHLELDSFAKGTCWKKVLKEQVYLPIITLENFKPRP